MTKRITFLCIALWIVIAIAEKNGAKHTTNDAIVKAAVELPEKNEVIIGKNAIELILTPAPLPFINIKRKPIPIKTRAK